jgi:hypothetical protein
MSLDAIIDLQTFFDLHPISKADKFTITKKYGSKPSRSVASWYALISKDFSIGNKFVTENTTATAVVVPIVEIKSITKEEKEDIKTTIKQ